MVRGVAWGASRSRRGPMGPCFPVPSKVGVSTIVYLLFYFDTVFSRERATSDKVKKHALQVGEKFLRSREIYPPNYPGDRVHEGVYEETYRAYEESESQ